MQERTTGSIALRPAHNSQGAYLFMSLTTGLRLNRQSFTPLTLPHEVTNGVHCLAHRNPKGLDIRYRYRRPFLEPEDGTNVDEDCSTYAPSDDDSRDNEYESDDNQRNQDNLNPPPDQEMEQQPAGVTIKNENAGVLQNVSTHSPQSGHNDPQNYPTIKMENTIDETGNENEAENEDENDAENEDKNGHEDPDKGENEQEDLEEAPTYNNNETDPDTMSDTKD